MQLIIVREDADPFALEVPDDADSDVLFQLVAAETLVTTFTLVDDQDRTLGMGEILSNVGIQDGSALTMRLTKAVRAPSLYDIPADISPDKLLALTRQHPLLLQQFRSSDPELGEVLATENLAKVRTLMMKRFMNHHQKDYQQKQEIRAMESDPDNPEHQKKIEEKIRLDNIAQNMAAALENFPEAFGEVTMLYVNIEVNGHAVKAFVDSGAQSTIMSATCAERCNITRLIDTRYAGEARGVGTARILGRVHIAQMNIGNGVFPISITVLESSDVDFLFGLDTLRRFRCCIDLNKNVLKIEGVNGPEEVPFLGESELPRRERLPAAPAPASAPHKPTP